MSIAAKQTLCPGMLPDIQSTKGDGEESHYPGWHGAN